MSGKIKRVKKGGNEMLLYYNSRKIMYGVALRPDGPTGVILIGPRGKLIPVQLLKKPINLPKLPKPPKPHPRPHK